MGPLRWTLIFVAPLGYWLLCRFLRWRRVKQLTQKFKGRDPYSLTVEEAQWVREQFMYLDMPRLSRFSTAFALFRTYGIPTIAQLLVKYFAKRLIRTNI